MLMLQVSGPADTGLGQAKAGAGSHWSFQKPGEPTVPSVRDSTWPRSEVDRFLLAKLEGAGLAPLGQADKRTLIRRATYDLTVIGFGALRRTLGAALAGRRPVRGHCRREHRHAGGRCVALSQLCHSRLQ